MNDSTRQYPRTLRSAFPSDYRESAIGIADPIEVGHRPLWLRVWKFLTRAWK